MKRLIISLLFCLGPVLLEGQVSVVADQAPDQTPAGTKLKHFGRVDQGVYKGSKPTSDADFRYLQSLNIKYIVDLEVIPWWYHWEQKRARRYGIELLSVRMNASPWSPSERHVETALAILHTDRCHPVYFHCALGRDRTAMVAALYKMYFQGLSPQQAERYLYASGYKDGWVRSGLKRYFVKHPMPAPVAVAPEVSACAS
jgi:protein tyrosine/serine phosphatase